MIKIPVSVALHRNDDKESVSQTKSTKPTYNVIPEIFEARKNCQESI